MKKLAYYINGEVNAMYALAILVFSLLAIHITALAL